MHMDALSFAASQAENLERDGQSATDDQLVAWYLSRGPPFGGAGKRLIDKSSLGAYSHKGIHDDGNAGGLATVHRQLTVPINGDSVGIRVVIAGRAVTVPTGTGSLLLWYGWLPHESCLLDTGKRRCLLTAPAEGLELDERAYATSYTRNGVEQFAEAVAAVRAAAGEGGLSPAPNLLVRVFNGDL